MPNRMSARNEEDDDEEEEDFEIWPELRGDKHFVLSLPLCDAYLNNDSTWPWVVLVPRRRDVVESIDLSEADQTQLMREMSICSKALLKGWPNITKLNTGMIGCVCRQLHCHVLGRFENDICWPKPVWGASEPVKYSEEEARKTCEKIEGLIRECMEK